MAFDYQGAINAGHTPYEINAYLLSHGMSQPSQMPPMPGQGGNFLGNLLSSLASPFVKTGQNIGGAAYELGRAADSAVGSPVAHALGNPNDYINQQGQGIGNPFLSDSQLQQAHQNPLGYVGDQTKASAGVTSYAVPFGAGAKMFGAAVPSLLTKAPVAGAISGGLQGMSQDNATPVSVAQNTLLGGAGSSATSGLFKMLGLGGKAADAASEGLQNLGSSIGRSQYNLPERVSEDLNFPEHYNNVVQTTGITNRQQQNDLAQQMLDAFTGVVNNAVKKSPPVDLGGMSDYAKGVLGSSYEIPSQQQGSILDTMNKAFGYGLDGKKDMVNADPVKVMQAIRDFEANGADHADAFQRTASVAEKHKALAFGAVADELRNRLYNGRDNTGGANDALATMLQDPSISDAIHAINPNLGMQFDEASPNGVQAVRHMMAPYVNISKANKYATNKAQNSVISPLEFFGAMSQLGGNPAHALAALAAEKAVNSNMGKGLLSGLLTKAGIALPHVQPPSPVMQQRINNIASHVLPSVSGASQL